MTDHFTCPYCRSGFRLEPMPDGRMEVTRCTMRVGEDGRQCKLRYWHGGTQGGGPAKQGIDPAWMVDMETV